MKDVMANILFITLIFLALVAFLFAMYIYIKLWEKFYYHDPASRLKHLEEREKTMRSIEKTMNRIFKSKKKG